VIEMVVYFQKIIPPSIFKPYEMAWEANQSITQKSMNYENKCQSF